MESPSNPTNTAPQDEVQPQKPATTTETVPTGPKNYLVMMLLAVFLLPSGLARAYLGEQAGWVRFWVFIGAYLLMIIPLINILAGLVLLGLAIWGLVDLFTLRKRTTDAAGVELAATPRDRKWAKAFFIYAMVALALGVLAFIAALSFGFWFTSNETMLDSYNTDPTTEYENDLRELIELETRNSN